MAGYGQLGQGRSAQHSRSTANNYQCQGQLDTEAKYMQRAAEQIASPLIGRQGSQYRGRAAGAEAD
jgi:hypothetical protein